MIFNKRMISSVMAAAMTAMTMLVFPAGSASAGETLTLNGGGQRKDTYDGYSYELWIDNTGGSGSMTLNSGGAFDTEWKCEVSKGNFLARRGKDFDRTKKATDIGNITLEYDATYSASSKGNSRLCVYGWMVDPLAEYYIIEDWVNWCPGPDASVFPSKTVTIDGADYEIFWIWHEGPTIEGGGNKTFKQYFSIRKSKRTSGTITVSDHFKAWEAAGMDIGNLTEVALNVEGWESSGRANVTKNVITVGGEPVPTEPTTEAQPDADGWFFHSDFESGMDSWSARGDASVSGVATASYEGAKSASVTGRTDSWNGIARSLDSSIFKPGSTYSFSAMAMQNASASKSFKLTLEYADASGQKHYDNVAKADGAKGEWVQLQNTEFTIPAGASGMILYVETEDTKTDFYVDEACGGKAGTAYAADVTVSASGDVYEDGSVNVTDIIALQKYLVWYRQAISNTNADMNGDKVINIFDLALLKAKVIKGGSQTTPPEPTTEPTTETTQPGVSYMATIKDTLTTDIGDANTRKAGVDYGQFEEISYYSSVAQRIKKANVLLPANYDPSKKYPVMYVNHGIFGDHNSMTDSGMGVQNISRNLAASGEAKDMIIVLTSMYNDPNVEVPSFQITLDVTQKYDLIREDIIECLMPYINEHYSTLTGRENTAICGFSMGGRESLYTGVTKPEYFGYIGAACPAPGVTPGEDNFMNHPGNMSESEFKITNPDAQPYVLFIAGGTNDGVVGKFPQRYDSILTTNGQEHLWLEVPGGGHDGSVVQPMMYNFIKNVFKAT